MKDYNTMNDTTLQLALILAFLAIAALLLPPLWFIRLVEIILDHGFKAVAQMLERQQVATHSLIETVHNGKSPQIAVIPTTLDGPATEQPEATPETK